MTSIQMFHEKLNAIQCFCGFVGRITSVKRQFKEKLSFAAVKIKRDKYNEERWSTDRDGYLVCGTCYEKISDEICTYCFCCVCYGALEEYCDCERDD